MKIFSRQHRKPDVPEHPVQLDRAATGDEIRFAARVSPRDRVETESAMGIQHETVIDFSKCEAVLPDDLAWYAIALEAETRESN